MTSTPSAVDLCGGSAASGSSLAGRDRWVWIQPVLTGASVVLPLLCVAAALTDERTTTGSKVLGASMAVAFAAWNVALGPAVTRSPADQILLPMVFVVVQFALFTTMVLTDPVYFFVSFTLYWRTFSVLPLRWAIPTAATLSALIVVLQVMHTGKSLLEQPTAALSGGFSIVFGTIMAIWISGIIDQSRERGSLIAELESTRAELAAVSHGAGALAERERLAHEIHDTLAQGFTSIVMLSQAADAIVDTDPGTARRHLQSIERTARDNLAEARHLVEGRGPAALSSGSLVDALHRLTGRLAGEMGIDAATVIEGEVTVLTPAAEVALLRAAQEALANVRKHAGATRVQVVLRFDAANVGEGGDAPEPEVVVTLEVRDDGRGFDTDTVDRGYGLTGMQSRLEQAGGNAQVMSETGQGTTVRVTLP